ncbi:MAG: TraR/DksA family transcriptional regulator [Candidatus Methylomirabilota bacterium]
MARAPRKAPVERTQAARILAERKSLQARLIALDRDTGLREQGQLTGDNTPTSDTLDTVQEAMAKEEALKARDALFQRLKVLARAEEKIRDGTYGLCESCGKPIPPARLQILPEALLCVRCAEQTERRTPRTRRG